MAALKVFHLIKGLGRGGAEMLLVDGPATSDKQRFEYGFGYFLPHKDALVNELQRSVGPVVRFEAKTAAQMLCQVPALARHLKAWRADLVHCHLPLAGAVGRLAATLAKVPVVYTEHNALERYHPWTRRAAQATWPLQREVIAVSADVAASIQRHLGQRVPVNVIRNGISPDRFHSNDALRAEGRRRLGVDDERIVIGSVAVFRKQKRLDLWLEVARDLVARRRDVVFVLVGDGPLRGEVEERVRLFDLGQHVILPGLQSEVRPFLAAFDMYLMTSDFEGVPLALLEAMSMQVPPVVTDAGGVPEVVENGVSGHVVPRGERSTLVQHLEALAGDAARRRALAAAARQRVIDRFSTARMMREIEEVYERAVAH